MESRRRRVRLLYLLAAAIITLILAAGTAAAVMTGGNGQEHQAAREDGATEVAAASGVAATSGASSTTTESGNDTASTSTSTSARSALEGESTTSTADTRAASTSSSTTSTSTPPSTTTTSAPARDSAAAGKVVAIDPGHQAQGSYEEEPVGPGSGQTKARVSSGTSGVVTGTPEGELVLAVSLLLREELRARGIRVVMTRTSQDVDLSNIDRTRVANQSGADLYIRVHADGSNNSGTSGVHVLYPESVQGWTDDIAAPSRRAAGLVLKELVSATGARNLGLNPRHDITGFNWSDVPVILPEIGFMTNPEEDRRLADAAYRHKIAEGLARGAERFLKGD